MAEKSHTSGRSTQWHQDKARATKAAVLEGAATVFNEVGYRSAVISAISRAAKVTPGGMYHYFDSKEAIAQEVLAEFQARWSAVPERAPEDSPLGLLISMTLRQMQRLHKDRIVRAGFRMTFEPGTLPTPNTSFAEQWLRSVTEVLADARTAGELSEDANADEIAWAIVSGFVGTYTFAETIGAHESLLERMEAVLAGALREHLAPQHKDRVVTALRYSVAAISDTDD
ncbi:MULTISPECIES: TetR/AcrR family transcriptional regulator [Leucobacter]|uniref:TetR/AcrR family transcriptional regulator n=1 Tax=Leucobacter TaxID=55968 RepID=UPI00210285CC|nr:TetR/AcrR family transcriptional regulator [Leucobacter aridicollis]UTX53976.1 TetR/AcrR family transcriptional regulator [Leucobacter aridicollis]